MGGKSKRKEEERAGGRKEGKIVLDFLNFRKIEL